MIAGASFLVLCLLDGSNCFRLPQCEQSDQRQRLDVHTQFPGDTQGQMQEYLQGEDHEECGPQEDGFTGPVTKDPEKYQAEYQEQDVGGDRRAAVDFNVLQWLPGEQCSGVVC